METQTKTEKQSTRKDVFAIVNDRIIEPLNEGITPWRISWRDNGAPRNLISQKAYRGINVILLASLGYERNMFVTSKQLTKIGGSLQPDAKPHIATFWSKPEKGVPSQLRYYTVFNIAECEGIPENLIPVNAALSANPIPLCLQIIENMPGKPRIQHKDKNAYYNPLTDVLNVSKQATFETVESYYAAFFHELVHSTGYHSRLNRKELIQMSEYGYDAYSHEELVAEIGTSYLLSHVGIPPQYDITDEKYIERWIERLKKDKNLIVSAANQAQKAVDYILNVKHEGEDKQQHEE